MSSMVLYIHFFLKYTTSAQDCTNTVIVFEVKLSVKMFLILYYCLFLRLSWCFFAIILKPLTKSLSLSLGSETYFVRMWLSQTARQYIL